MRKINKITAIFALFIATLAAGCTSEFEYFNTNHHEATNEQMGQDNLNTGAFFRQLQRTVVYFKYGSDETFLSGVYQLTQNLNADQFAGYLTGTLVSNGGNNMGSYNLRVVQNWLDTQFNYSFTYNMSAWLQLKTIADELGQPETAALGTIVKVEAMHRTADYYGPIPYISFGSGSMSNNYDTVEDIYKKFLEELDEAIDVLTVFVNAHPEDTIMADYDYVYNGNITQWIKFANTLRLRLALRIVYANESLAQAEAQKSLTHSLGMLSEAGDVAQLNRKDDLATYYHPLYEISNDWGDTVAGASIITYMNGYSDPRRPAYFKAISNNYYGMRSGWHSTTNSTIKSYTSAPVTDQTTMPIVWMRTSESLFLQAEAALRGWGGNAQTLYNAAIQMSMTERGVAIGSYMNQGSGNKSYTPYNNNSYRTLSPSYTINNVPAVAWGSDFEQNLERIMIQKYIAIFPDGAEAWAEARRTGYPRLVPVVNNDSDGQVPADELISRLVFPTVEQLQNPEGYASGVAALGGLDSPGTRLWWDCHR